jgi:hypothetical protein
MKDTFITITIIRKDFTGPLKQAERQAQWGM